jgi:hypothetical protein
MKYLFFLFLISSCSILKPVASLKTIDKEVLLKSVKLTGEGRGRLTFNHRQYVFQVDSVLNDGYDWIFSVSIPLQGEEVLIMPDLRQKKAHNHETESFEKRIGREFYRLKFKNTISSDQFFRELRSLIRFLLAPAWEGKKVCKKEKELLLCEFDQEMFIVTSSEKEFSVIKKLNDGLILQIVSRNLTESFFDQTDIFLYLNEKDLELQKRSFSLEIFW